VSDPLAALRDAALVVGLRVADSRNRERWLRHAIAAWGERWRD